MIREAKLNTLDMFKYYDTRDCDYELWQKIAEFMNGEIAWVIESSACDGQYVFLGLKNAEKNKELFYMMEQDSTTGVFIEDREGFDKVWDNEEYEHDGCFYLEPQYLILSSEKSMRNELKEVLEKCNKATSPNNVEFDLIENGWGVRYIRIDDVLKIMDKTSDTQEESKHFLEMEIEQTQE